MKWMWKTFWICVLVMGFYSFVLAQDKKDMAMVDKDKMAGDKACGKMCDKGMMDKDMMMGMGKMMMGKAMVATADGGVIVLMGNKLQKYDKDLALVKEVELKMDEQCQKFMMPGKYHKGDMMGGEENKKEEPATGQKARPNPY